MYDDEKEMFALARSSNLNEQLGMVHYIFSDKTGTLTQNIMEFKKFSIGYKTYGSSHPAKKEYEPGLTNVNFEDNHYYEDCENADDHHKLLIHKWNMILSLCHTVIIDEKKDYLAYGASSPDELALVNAARYFDYVFKKRDEYNNLIMTKAGVDSAYQLLRVIEFTSSRKRMSVIVKDAQGKIMLYCKGADSIIIERLKKGQSDLVD
jgi:phospholipid-translocating ATPase